MKFKYGYARGVAEIAVMVAIMVVCSWISIPVGVPVTLQTFAVFLGIYILGEKKATFALLAYVVLGSVGVPVFSGFQSGVGVIAGPTMGFIIGFFCLPLCSFAFKKLAANKPWGRTAGLIVGQIFCYTLGTLWFTFVFGGGAGGISAALAVCVFPFVLPDALKLIFAIALSKIINKAIKK